MRISNTVVTCRRLSKTFITGDVQTHALRGVDLDVNGGEFMMLVGPSGCGKTTLISVIAAILTQDDGDCEVFDHNLATMNTDALLAFRGKKYWVYFSIL